jgi:thiol-disulfide isomerase/thioredoxin
VQRTAPRHAWNQGYPATKKKKKTQPSGRMQSKTRTSRSAKSGVFVYTSERNDDLRALLADGGAALVAFTMRGCGHCVALKPALDTLATKRGATVINVDYTQLRAFTDRSGIYDVPQVRGFPTVVLVNDSRVVAQLPGNGDRSVDGLLAFAASNLTARPEAQRSARTAPGVFVYSSDRDSDLRVSLKSGDTKLVAFTMQGCGHCVRLKPTLAALAAQDVAVVNVDAREIRSFESAGGITGLPSIRGFPTLAALRGRRIVATYPPSGDRSPEALKRWLTTV